jgi:hypothetical protein
MPLGSDAIITSVACWSALICRAGSAMTVWCSARKQGAVCRSAGDAAGKGADVGFKDRCVGVEPPE